MMQDDIDPDTLTDPDMRSAWEELDSYMKDQEASTAHEPRRPQTSSDFERDMKNLELSKDASFEDVKRAYKRLLIEYHPDRHGTNATTQQIATEITQRINASYRRLKTHFEAS